MSLIKLSSIAGVVLLAAIGGMVSVQGEQSTSACVCCCCLLRFRL